MIAKSSTLCIKGMKFYAFHGVLEQERKIGGEYLVDVSIDNVGLKAADSDQLEDTVNYAAIVDIVAREMEKPSDLIEHVAGRIVNAILQKFTVIKSGSVSITKVHPPIQTPLSGAAFTLNFSRE